MTLRDFFVTAAIAPGGRFPSACEDGFLFFSKRPLSGAGFTRGNLLQAGRVGHILMDEEAAPAAFHRVEMLPVEWDAGADDLHVARAVVP